MLPFTENALWYGSRTIRNQTIEEAVDAFRDLVVIYAADSFNASQGVGRYCVLMTHGDRHMLFQRKLENATSSNQCGLQGILEAVASLRSGCSVVVVGNHKYEFRSAFEGKGSNVEIVQRILTILHDKGCALFELHIMTRGENIIDYIAERHPDEVDLNEFLLQQITPYTHRCIRATGEAYVLNIAKLLTDRGIPAETIDDVRAIQIPTEDIVFAMRQQEQAQR